MKNPRARAVFLAAVLVTVAAPPASAEFDHRHTLYGTVLDRFVENSLVDYKSLKADPATLSAYLDSLSTVSRQEFNGWSEAQQLAYLYNLYNADTLKLIIDHYPIKSIKDIGNVFKGPWDQPVVRLFGESITLGHLEHKIIRVNYNEPRGHFALVCAAKGCPPLRPEPYVPDRLNEQLEDQGRVFMAAAHKNRVDAAEEVAHLSPIFDWFTVDFEKKSGSVMAFVRPYFPPERARALRDNFKIRYTDYDWSLNEQK